MAVLTKLALTSIIEKVSLATSFIPINKSGSGAEALRYMKDKSGDDHTVMMNLNSFYTTPIIQTGLGVDPIPSHRLMAMDIRFGYIPTKDITDIKSYVSAVKSAGKTGKWAALDLVRKTVF